MHKSVEQMLLTRDDRKRILYAVGFRKAHKFTINENRTHNIKEGKTEDTQFNLDLGVCLFNPLTFGI